MFRASSAHLQEDTIVYMQHMVLAISMRVRGGLSVHSLCENWMFRALSAHLQEDTIVYMQHLVLSQFMVACRCTAVHRQATMSDSTICCMYTIVSS